MTTPSHLFPVIISSAEIADAEKAMAVTVANRATGKRVVVVQVMEGARQFSNGLLWALGNYLDSEKLDVGSLTARSYDGDKSTGKVDIKIGETLNLLLWDIYVWPLHRLVIVDDIYDTGRTAKAIVTYLHEHYLIPYECMEVVTLLWKPPMSLISEPPLPPPPIETSTPVSVPVFSALPVPDTFVVGYGLDYNGKYRDLPHIAEFKP
jgi:hypoxanthine phosphoribosyltransferase